MHFYRLYYLMVHLDKFGRSYKQAVADEMQAILQAGKSLQFNSKRFR